MDEPRFHDECDVDGCDEPVVKLVADTVVDEDGRRRETTGLCSDHKRDPTCRYDYEEELPF